MIKSILFTSLLIILLSCDNTFRAEKIETEDHNNGFIYEIHLVENLPYSYILRDSILKKYTEKKIKEKCGLDSNLSKFGFAFYRNVSCTRRYYKNYENLKGIESVGERCEDYYCGSFIYERSKQNKNIWYLSYSKNIKDTLHCNKK